MTDRNSKNWDKRPKRRRDKDNPYELYSVGAGTPDAHYYVSFRDGLSEEHFFEISKEIFDELDRFELEDLSRMNESDNHYERSDLSERSLNQRAVIVSESLETLIGRKLEDQRLHKAIIGLPPKQRRRLILYFFESYTQQQVAEMEGCSQAAVAASIAAALKNLKRILGRGL